MPEEFYYEIGFDVNSGLSQGKAIDRVILKVSGLKIGDNDDEYHKLKDKITKKFKRGKGKYTNKDLISQFVPIVLENVDPEILAILDEGENIEAIISFLRKNGWY